MYDQKLIKDLQEGKILLYFNRETDDLEDLKRILKAAFPCANVIPTGEMKFYGKGSGNLWVSYFHPQLKIKTMTEFKQNFTIEGPRALKEALSKETGIDFYSDESLNYPYISTSNIVNKLIGEEEVYPDHYILPRDWDKVVELLKPTTKLFTLNSDSGLFHLEVSKKGIVYVPESSYLNVDKLEAIITPKTILDSWYKYSQNIESVNLGCKKNVPIGEIEEVINHFKNIKQCQH